MPVSMSGSRQPHNCRFAVLEGILPLLKLANDAHRDGESPREAPLRTPPQREKEKNAAPSKRPEKVAGEELPEGEFMSPEELRKRKRSGK